MRLASVGTLLYTGAILAGCAPPGPPASGQRAQTELEHGERQQTRALVVSDLNGPYGTVGYSPTVTAALQEAIREFRPEMIIVAGDLVAGQSPSLSDERVREMWVAFDSVVAGPIRAAGIPLVVAMGNHDASAYPAHSRDRRLAREHWSGHPPPPPVVDREQFPFRYTVLLDDVFVAVWDATRQESAGDTALLGWLRRSLESTAARAASHRVVVGHLPLYPVAEDRDRVGEFLMSGDSLRRELERLGATLFISGHHHAFYPGRSGDLALLYAGALGSGPRRLLGGGATPRNALAVVDFLADTALVRGFEVSETGALRPISFETLPPAVCSGNWMVARLDLDPRLVACPEARDR